MVLRDKDTSLNSATMRNLLLVGVINMVLFVALGLENLEFINGDLTQVLSSVSASIKASGLIYAILMVPIHLCIGVFPRSFKEWLVFSPQPRPGSRAFSHYMSRDSAIDEKALNEKLGPFPDVPNDQNALWVSWLHEFDGELRIRSAYSRYLVARDWAVIAAVLLILGSPLAYVVYATKSQAIWYIVTLLVQFILTRQAARVQGAQLVKSVLVRKGTSLKKSQNSSTQD